MKYFAFVVFLVVTTGCGYSGEETVFVLENTGDRDLYRQDVSASTDDAWITFEADGEPMALSGSCRTICGPGGTATIEECAARRPQTALLAPGGTDEVAWNGTYWVLDADRQCWKERTRKADFTAEFCYADNPGVSEGSPATDPDGDGVYLDATLEDTICETVAFERGEEVLLEAE
jgi:hypothetical protein